MYQYGAPAQPGHSLTRSLEYLMLLVFLCERGERDQVLTLRGFEKLRRKYPLGHINYHVTSLPDVH
jgi:hypothetical protein